jgi:hypothetical protein
MFGYNKLAMINGLWFFMPSMEIAGPLNGGTKPYIYHIEPDFEGISPEILTLDMPYIR